jgi:DAACS family dicarboxylate/amino acid:cation (Na+ or H+) symporter
MSLHNKILLGLVLGAVCGVAVNYFAGIGRGLDEAQRRLVGLAMGGSGEAALQAVNWREPTGVLKWLLTYVMEPVGQIFLRMLLLTVVPLVFASLAVGVAKLGAMGNLGRVGARTMVFFVGSMAVAVVIGLTLVNTIRPGEGLPEDTRRDLLGAYGGEAREKAKAGQESKFGVGTFINIVPRNPLQAMSSWPPDMLAVIFFALLVGIGLTVINPDHARLIIQMLEGLNDLMVFIINLAMKLAPYGVFAFLFIATARFGFDILIQLGKYVFVVLLGLALHFFGVFSLLVRIFSGLNPLTFFHKVRAVIVTAFSTSSSSATLPTSLKVSQEELGVPAPIAGFVLPLGATMNMNGTALFEGVTVVFLAQVYGVPLDLADQAIVIVLAVLTAIGAAGVPGGSLPLLVIVLTAVGVPAEGLAIIIGVDRLLDMCRTTLNVVGDITCATYIARSEGFPLMQTTALSAAAPPASSASSGREPVETGSAADDSPG